MILLQIIKAMIILSLLGTLSNPISYKVEYMDVHERPQRIYTLKVDVKDSNLLFQGALSKDSIYGFDKTSEILKQKNSLFGVNGMFYDSFGVPYGILIMKHQVVKMDSIGTPIFILTGEGQADLEEFNIYAKVRGKDKEINLFGTNRSVPQEEWVLFDSKYGKTTRVARKSMNYVIENEKVIQIIASDVPVSIQEGTYILTHVTEEKEQFFELGETLEIDFISDSDLEIDEIAEAFQTGGWLVRDGKNVAKSKEMFMGFTTALNPRTLIGITRDKEVVLKVIDGRKPGISMGVTGQEAAELMVKEGCIEAAYLDGGASSTMVVMGKVVNSPSKGEERKVSHGIAIGFKSVWSRIKGLASFVK